MGSTLLQSATGGGAHRAWLWERPDLPLVEAAADGELALARLRLAVTLVLYVWGSIVL